VLDNLVYMLLNVDERYREVGIVHRILNYITLYSCSMTSGMEHWAQ